MLPPTINYTVAVTTIFDHQISHIFSLSETSKKNHSIPPPLQKNNLESPKKQDKEIIPKNTKIDVDNQKNRYVTTNPLQGYGESQKPSAILL